MSLSAYNLSELVIDNYLNVASEYSSLYGKFNDLIKKSLGYNELYAYDLSVSNYEKSNQNYTIEQAQEILKNAFSVYGDEYIKYLEEIFDTHMVDYIPTKNKRTGAFSTGAYGIGSIAFVNYHEKLENISTLAHELGHAVHSRYTYDYNPPVYGDSSFLLVEIASITNEIIFSEYFLKNTKNVLEKYELLKEMLDTLLGNFFMVAGRMELQNYLYENINNGVTLTKDIIDAKSLEVSKKYELNNADIIDENKNVWTKVSHYFSLYYNYQYAIGVSIAAYFASTIINKEENATENYLKFLKMSGTKYPSDLLKEFNIDLEDKNTFMKIVNVINSKLDELEETIKKLEK